MMHSEMETALRLKHKCRCGEKVPHLTSYFQIGSKVRVTVCDNCANEHGFQNKEKFLAVPYNSITQEQNIYNTSGATTP